MIEEQYKQEEVKKEEEKVVSFVLISIKKYNSL